MACAPVFIEHLKGLLIKPHLRSGNPLRLRTGFNSVLIGINVYPQEV